MTSSAQQDEAAVAAVQRGDPERYRELVERHKRRVFAVAWSRLGDAALAEEVTQEAFIRAYRRLWLLGDGAKFSGWVNTIARRLAINFGLRHRRELNRRERWALENSGPAADVAGDEAEPQYTPETLRQTLAELPPAHRECLVLFYLEGKSGAEAAAALGISESALRVRLHRARAVMRERLEDKLEGLLAKLGPAKTLVPAVMAAVLASSSAKAATAGGAGAAVATGLAKFSPFKWLFFFVPLLLPLLMLLPGLFVQRWLRRGEQRNYRDPQGFRASLHRELGRKWPARLLLIVIVPMVVLLVLANHIGGRNSLFLIIGLGTLLATGFAVRKLEINRSRAQLGMVASHLVLGLVCVGVFLGWFPVLTVSIAALIATGLIRSTSGSSYLRMDHNLFLRVAQGVLRPGGAAVPIELHRRIDRPGIRAFARFLGERQMVNEFSWKTRGLVLGLPALNPSSLDFGFQLLPFSRDGSRLVLGWDGKVAAHCGRKDAAGLAALPGNSVADLTALENQVAAAVTAAWRDFRDGRISAAAQILGHIPESDIFVMPPARIRVNRGMWIFIGAILAVSLTLFGTSWLFPESLSGMKPVSITEAQVRSFLNGADTAPNPDPKKFNPNSLDRALFNCLVLPPTNLYSPEGLQTMRSEVASGCGFGTLKQNGWQALAMGDVPLTKLALLGGWIGWEETGVKPQDCADYLHQNRSANVSRCAVDRILTLEEAWSWVDEKKWEVSRINLYSLNQLRWLHTLNCLDLVDRAELIRQIAAVQDVSATPAPGQPLLHDWRDVRGLFFTPCYPALQDTYFSLAALEMLGGLDKIDREACVQGILRRHEGRGYFTSPSPGNFNEYHIDGSAHDTIAAFESLRILGALDRVKDLDHWEFRVSHQRSSQPDAQGVRTLTWDEVEAWVCQQRLAKILQERRDNPSAPIHSLLEP